MQVAISYPSAARLEEYLHRQASESLSYSEHGGTRYGFLSAYDNDEYAVRLGRGEAVWKKAKRALRNWKQFPEGWTRIYPEFIPLQRGEQIVIIIRLLGLWWINSTRIVYTIDQPNRFGFAYGTLPGHVEQGEELFVVEYHQNGEVYYRIRAFSKPGHWLVQLVYPLARWLQRRFSRQSLQRMQELMFK